MASHELEAVLGPALQIANGAAALVEQGFRRGARVEKKGVIDLVTEFDLKSEELIRRELGTRFPDHLIVAEEGQDADARPDEQALVWYVDPLDGTTNFAHGHPFFCVSMALYRGAEGQVAVVVAPALGTVWTAVRGGGAFRNGQRCRVSTTDDISDALCATGFPYDKWTNPDNNTTEFGAFLRRSHGVRRGGSAAIDLAMTADGTFDLYWEQRLQAWDMAAGALLVEEAGGELSDYDGGSPDARIGRLVASNGRLHATALAVLAEARAPIEAPAAEQP